jgi:hypothetical protein
MICASPLLLALLDWKKRDPETYERFLAKAQQDETMSYVTYLYPELRPQILKEIYGDA